MDEIRARHGLAVGKRIQAVLSLVMLLVLFSLSFALLVPHVFALLIGLCGCLALVMGGAWFITKLMPRRLLGLIGVLVGAVLLVVALLMADGSLWTLVWKLLLLLGVTAVHLTLARFALERDQEPHEPDLAHRGAKSPTRPVLIYNARSGDGKVAEFDIVARAQAQGVTAVALEEGADLTELARQAVADGADCLGMAGGDGSQALVAAVAVEAGLPFVCIPAGTRNHFARDLGLDVTDPGSVLEAFVKGRRRLVDYGTVGERFFVNNVSLGAYASIAQSPEYRESKLATALGLLPDIIGPEAQPADLAFTTPEGEQVGGATVLLVSNNAYALGIGADAASRPSICDGVLGVLAVRAEKATDALAAVAQAGLGLINAGSTLLAFEVTDFAVQSSSPRIDAAIDGEAVTLDAPLHFTIHPRGLILLLPSSSRHLKRSISLRRLVAVALGQT